MLNFIKKFFDYNEQELTRIRKIVEEINGLEDKARHLENEDFKKETEKLKKQIQSETKTLDEVLPWSFALVREAARRSLGQRHYDVQLIAGIAMHEGKIVEQKTGEGKTLTATLPLFLNALTGRGVHLVTVNDYLARRDAGWMGQVFEFLGLTTSAIASSKSFIYDPTYTDSEGHDPRLTHLKPISRKEAYQADVTYGINSEFGFDYLRDNMAQTTQRLVQRGFYFSIVDEADSVLIDEARTPHIISAPFDEDTSRYYEYAKIVKQLSAETDFVIDEKLRTAHLTEIGIERIEKILNVDNVYEKNFDTLFYIEAALKAETLFQNDKEYIVRNNEVIIVDEFTGRLLEGRRFSEGLHQAIEAKEGVPIQRESRTLATVSLQNYFRMYEKLAGMTGTAQTEAEEFSKIYGTDVLVVPTHRSNQRQDHADMIFKTERAKYNAVVEDIAEQYKKGRPVLVGTTSIDKNELVHKLLAQKGIPHEVLNAKNHEREAQIISQAGKKHAVTVATNMAGRGVDIVLGGEVIRDDYKNETEYKKALADWEKEHKKVVELGGLYVIGTERHESRRIDNQLRGRSGRQGDPGETRFYVSLEDDVMRIFGGDKISSMMTMLNFPEDQPLSHPMVSKAIEQAQVKVEGFNFDIRKHLVEYDDVLNRQRDIIYSLRRKMLKLPEEDAGMFETEVERVMKEQITSMSASFYALKSGEQEIIEQFEKDVQVLFEVDKSKLTKYLEEDNQEQFEEYLINKAIEKYKAKSANVGPELWNQVVRSIFLSTIDQYWTQHLTAIDDLRQGINLRGYAQMDPLVEYKNEAFTMFENLLSDIHYEAIRRVMRVEVEKVPPQSVDENQNEHVHLHYHSASKIDPFSQQAQQPLPVTQSASRSDTQLVSSSVSQLGSKSVTQSSSSSVAQSNQLEKISQRNTSVKKLGRNDPCWCGSGKKYKKCHYPNIP